MAFRDDRDALRARNEALEGDLDDARERLDEAEKALADHEQKDAQDAKDLKALRKEVDQLRSRLGMAPKTPTNRAPMIAMGIATSLLIAGGVAGVLMFRASAPNVESVENMPLAVPPAPPVPAPPTLPTVPASPLDIARYGAEVLFVEGLDLAVGDACQVDARLSLGPNVESLRVVCGDVEIYESRMDGGVEITMHESNVREIARGEAFVYVLDFRDTGQRTGVRPQIRVEGRRGEVVLSRDSDDPFRLTLRIDDHSYPRFGNSLGSLGAIDTAPRGEGFRLRAVTTRTSGPAPTILDQACEVLAHPDAAGGNLNCRILVRCGGDVIYGADNTGYNTCTMQDGIVESANDQGASSENSDPILQLDRSAQTLRLADDNPADWEILFRLEEHPLCQLDGRWTGTVTRADGNAAGVSLNGGVLALDLADSTSLATASEVDCVLGEGTLVGHDGERWEGIFGPGFQTFIGRARGGDPQILSLQRSSRE